MRVEYTCTYNRVNEAIDNAKAEDMEIEFIELNAIEWHYFLKKAGIHLYNTTPCEPPIDHFLWRDTIIRKKEGRL